MTNSIETISVKIRNELKIIETYNFGELKRYYLYDSDYKIYSLSQGFINIEHDPGDTKFSLSEIDIIMRAMEESSSNEFNYTTDLEELKEFREFQTEPEKKMTNNTPHHIVNELERIVNSSKSDSEEVGLYRVLDGRGRVYTRYQGFQIFDPAVTINYHFTKKEAEALINILSAHGDVELTYKLDRFGTLFNVIASLIAPSHLGVTQGLLIVFLFVTGLIYLFTQL